VRLFYENVPLHSKSERMDVFSKLKNKVAVFDEEFDLIFPEDVREHSNRHFTSVFIAQQAAAFLTEEGAKTILDIGSGTGKFCLVASATSKAHYTGVEHRTHHVEIGNDCAKRYGLLNCKFIADDILNVDFSNYDAFYIFNPFLEAKDPTAQMDQVVKVGLKDYDEFSNYVYQQFDSLRIGTRIASYWTSKTQIPPSYELVKSAFGDTLTFWRKIS
jgi:predicted RNA methylase